MIFNPSSSSIGSGSSDKSDLVKGTYPVAAGDSISAGDLVNVINGNATKKQILSEFNIGDIVQLRENGFPIDFYIAANDYESEYNTAGRKLLVRKECYDLREFRPTGTGTYGNYEDSALDTWLNTTYKALLDSDIQSSMGTTKFTVNEYPGSYPVVETQIERSIFILSYNDFQPAASDIPIADTLTKATLNGEGCIQWTRTTYSGNYGYAYAFDIDGSAIKTYSKSDDAGSRPCFTLPNTAAVYGNNFKAIALTSGTAGQDVEVIFCGTTSADFATEGEYFNWDGEGVKAYAPMDGVLTVFPWYEPQPDVSVTEFGSFVGTNTSNANDSTLYSYPVNLGYRPKGVFVTPVTNPISNANICIGIAYDGSPLVYSGVTGLEVTDTGFIARTQMTKDVHLARNTVRFVAWR